jgi:amidase
MSSLVRRSLVWASTLTLLLGVLGAAPAALGAQPRAAFDPTSTVLRGIDIDATTIPQLQRLMDRGRLSSAQLTRFYLERIRHLDPLLNAIIKLNDDAVDDARAADRARRRGVDKPLLGIPVLLKDNINTTGLPTTAGSWALAGSRPSDAFIVERLRAAGAIVLGKLNLSEWANFRSTPSSSGWSGIGGQNNMAYVLDRNPCGSSSGSGVATSANLATITVGTETDGSIVCPSGANGVVGIKPTLGLWSREGIIPITADQDTAGPMARNVTDAAVLLGALTGVDSNDPATRDQRGNAFRNYRQFLDDESLEGARIGIWRTGTYDPAIQPEVHAIMNATVAALEAEGATVIDETRVLI